MEELLYQMIFKRKSFHIFKGEKKLTVAELSEIQTTFDGLKPLVDGIEVAIRIVPRRETSCPRGEYCILFYSEAKAHYLQNIGYLGEQLDLWLASRNIGVCWYGLGKTEKQSFRGLPFVAMQIIEKLDESLFRKDMFKSKRKPLAEIWMGNDELQIANIVRFAPSSCNIQPWLVQSDGDKLTVYRYKKPGKRGMVPVHRVTFTNRIDIGIFLLFLELCLTHGGTGFKRTLHPDTEDEEMTLYAEYLLTK